MLACARRFGAVFGAQDSVGYVHPGCATLPIGVGTNSIAAREPVVLRYIKRAQHRTALAHSRPPAYPALCAARLTGDIRTICTRRVRDTSIESAR